jgi:hypothetical protein
VEATFHAPCTSSLKIHTSLTPFITILLRMTKRGYSPPRLWTNPQSREPLLRRSTGHDQSSRRTHAVSAYPWREILIGSLGVFLCCCFSFELFADQCSIFARHADFDERHRRQGIPNQQQACIAQGFKQMIDRRTLHHQRVLSEPRFEPRYAPSLLVPRDPMPLLRWKRSHQHRHLPTSLHFLPTVDGIDRAQRLLLFVSI